MFTVGLGDTTAPEDVRIQDVDYSSVVPAPSRATITATVSYTGGGTKQVSIRLVEGPRTIFRRDTVLTHRAPQLEQSIPVRFTQPGRREFELTIDVSGYDAEPENNRRDVVIEAEKARSRVLVVDLTPGWEFHFLSDHLRRDQAYDFELVTSSARPAAATGSLVAPEDFVSRLPECDAVVLGAVSDEFLSDAVVEALERFVVERGGGVLVLPGDASLFEHRGAWNRAGELMPLEGTPPFRFALRYTSVVPGGQAPGNPVTAHLLPLFTQVEWQERSPLLGHYTALSPKRISEVLLAVKGSSLPALTYRTAGKGRVIAVSAGPLWRWKFLSDENSVYDEMMSRVLDVLSRGEETDRFVVSTRKRVFEAGESPEFHAELFNEKMQPVTGAPIRVEVARVEDGGETPLALVSMRRDGAESTRFRCSLDPLPPGRYVVRGRAELGDRAIASSPVEIRVSSTSVEFQRVSQDRSALVSIARRTGGHYTPASIVGLARRLPLEPRTVSVVREITLRTSVRLFLAIVALLSIEWIIRKRAGMI